jgi:hypothetical protein
VMSSISRFTLAAFPRAGASAVPLDLDILIAVYMLAGRSSKKVPISRL